jgi:ribosomal protein L11 methyltransferase
MTDRGLLLFVTSPGDKSAEISDLLIDFGGSAVQETDGGLVTFIAESAVGDAAAFANKVRLGLEVAGVECVVEWDWQEAEDWSREWRRGLRPRPLGRVVVAPSWTSAEVRDGYIVLKIDPVMAFGTGEHATTRGCLRLLGEYVLPGDRVLDVGTGSAILAIAAARLGAASVLAVESDPDAIENAQDNVARNEATPTVRIDCALVDDAYLADAGAGAFDLILANVLSGVLMPLLPSFREALAEDGRLLLSGILETEADAMIEAAERAGFALQTEDLEDEWWSALLRVAF